MTTMLLCLLSMQWAYLDDTSIQGWFANHQGKPKYSIYYDKKAQSAAIVHWSQHPRETIPLACVLTSKGIHIQPQHLRPLDPYREMQQ